MREACLGDSLFAGGSVGLTSGPCDNLGSGHEGRAKVHGRAGRNWGILALFS